MTFHKLSNPNTSSKIEGKVIALGCFDGFHLGHRGVISAAIQLSRSLSAEPSVFCFNKPPASYAPNSNVMILGGDDRLNIFKDCGISSVYIVDFPEIKNIDAEEFIQKILIEHCSARGVVCGFNFKFGKDRAGTPDLLKQYFGDNTITLEPVYFNEAPISSSRIRSALSEGNIELANQMLGRNYSIESLVSSGRQDGRKLGFPTINQIPDSQRAIPASGVYVTKTTLPDGNVYKSITDVGVAPTLDKTGIIRLETHILDTEISYQPSFIKVEFLSRIRPEKHFDSVDALKNQISSDSEYARNYFAIN